MPRLAPVTSANFFLLSILKAQKIDVKI